MIQSARVASYVVNPVTTVTSSESVASKTFSLTRQYTIPLT
jgi:hypothetical protein